MRAPASGGRRLEGRYRGSVVNNIDPFNQGRLLVSVPDALGDDPCLWAESASPLVGSQMGIYAVPPIGSGVWVEFQQGDPNDAVWTGGYRGSTADVPPMATAAPPALPPIVIQSQAQNRIIISSAPGDGIRLETAQGPAGPSIQISTAAGIVLSDGTGGMVTISKGVVTINQGALLVK
jgi:Type VI secretion system/phage-baseplate injector OB domain